MPKLPDYHGGDMRHTRSDVRHPRPVLCEDLCCLNHPDTHSEQRYPEECTGLHQRYTWREDSCLWPTQDSFLEWHVIYWLPARCHDEFWGYPQHCLSNVLLLHQDLRKQPHSWQPATIMFDLYQTYDWVHQVGLPSDNWLCATLCVDSLHQATCLLVWEVERCFPGVRPGLQEGLQADLLHSVWPEATTQ